MSITIRFYHTVVTTLDSSLQRTQINADPTSWQTTDEMRPTESDILSALESIPPPTTHKGLSTSDKVAVGCCVAVVVIVAWNIAYHRLRRGNETRKGSEEMEEGEVGKMEVVDKVDAEEKEREEERDVPCNGEKKKEFGTEVRREGGVGLGG
jgi:hypothetical protein